MASAGADELTGAVEVVGTGDRQALLGVLHLMARRLGSDRMLNSFFERGARNDQLQECEAVTRDGPPTVLLMLLRP
jgi:hypothetical protein